MNLTLCFPTLNRYDLLAQAVASAYAGTRPPDKVVVIDNGGGCPEVSGAEVFRLGYNLGVAGSWNWFLDHCDDWLVISNDDVRFHPETLEKLIQAAQEKPEQIFFCPASGAGQAWALFLQRKRSLEIVGHYDEQFWPAWHEDNDYTYRMRQVGQHENHAPCAYGHGIGSTTSVMPPAQRELFHAYFRNTQRRYLLKWGGLPGQETFKTPFGA